MKKHYASVLALAFTVFVANAQMQSNELLQGLGGPPSSGGNCIVNNMGGNLASGFLGWVPGDGSLWTWFDIAGTPGCGLSYPFTLQSVDINIADPSAFGLPAGSGTGTLTYQVNVYDAMTPGDPCTEPGALVASSGNISSIYADEGTHLETNIFNEVLGNAFFVEWHFVSWTGPGPENPSPLWDDVFRPLCRQWITNDGGTTVEDFTDFFTEGDTGWVDMSINGNGTVQTSNCTVDNSSGTLAAGFLGWIPGDGSIWTWFDVAGTPGCGMTYPYTLQQVDINIADPTGFGLPPGNGTGTLTYQINLYDGTTPGDPCSEPGTMIASSGNISSAYADEGVRIESIGFNEVLSNAFFVEWHFVSWTGPGPEVPSPLWDDVFRPLCRQWITNDGGTTLMDQTDFFAEGDTGWVDLTIDGTATAGGGPPNDECTGAVGVTLLAGVTETVSGDVTGATDTEGLGTNQVWESFILTQCMDVIVDFCGTVPDPTAYPLILLDVCPIDANDLIFGSAATGACSPLEVTFIGLQPGQYYYPVFDDLGVTAYTLTFTGTPCPAAPANDECVDAILLSPSDPCSPIIGSTLGATESLPAITCNNFTSSVALDVWYQFVATATTHDVIVTGTGDFDAIVELFEGTCAGLTSIDCADATVGGETETIAATGLTPGNTYYVRVYAWNGGVTDFEFDICVVGAGGMVNNSPNLEGFEGNEFPPLCWNNLDEDGDGEMWFRSGLPGVTPNSGDSCALSASWLNGVILSPENYLILPQVTPGVDEHLTYWVAAQDPAYPSEFYGIVVSTTGMAAADFSTELFSETLIDEVWVERTVDLSAYQGMDIYIAFKHYNVSDQFWMKIDDVQWPTETMPCIPTTVEETAGHEISVFPNPASNYITVRNNGNSLTATVELLDMNGKVVLTSARTFTANGDQVIDLTEMAPGIYMLSLTNDEGLELRRKVVVE